MGSAAAGRPRRILLLGGSGFIGRNLAAALRRAGHEVTLTGRTAASVDGAAVSALPLTATATILALIDARQIDTVVHLVSTMLPSSTAAQFEHEQHAVIAPTVALAGELAARGVALIFVSSGGTVYGALRNERAREDDACAPISLYGEAKRRVELALLELNAARGLRLLIVRPSNPYGTHQALDGAQGLVSVLLGRTRDGRALDVWGDGSSVRDYLHVADLVRSMRDLIEQEVLGTIVNIGSGAGHSLLDVVATVEAATGRRIALNFTPARAADVPRLVLDIARLRALGMDHARPLAAGVRAYAAELGLAAD
ncbi:NAD-dependent epimerase/dehydratase family protein [Sphingomonas sp. TZW2008]|uniref:NAD-dependent epimerase/dehydratase family protein n=1 Tax=Sphingomonas sp. TZW2008 TaxID=1917973 RepID=UPI000A268B45|nr:NAD-dependent epimerase/dehydratase family protein [Sphingomonas sp. TZW2008]